MIDAGLVVVLLWSKAYEISLYSGVLRDYLKLVNLFLISGKKITFCFAGFLLSFHKNNHLICFRKRTIHNCNFFKFDF